MILSFIFFLILFLGGIVLMGLAQGFADFQALSFCIGLALVCLSMAWMMRGGKSGATRRANNWDGGPSAL